MLYPKMLAHHREAHARDLISWFNGSFYQGTVPLDQLLANCIILSIRDAWLSFRGEFSKKQRRGWNFELRQIFAWFNSWAGMGEKRLWFKPHFLLSNLTHGPILDRQYPQSWIISASLDTETDSLSISSFPFLYIPSNRQSREQFFLLQPALQFRDEEPILKIYTHTYIYIYTCCFRGKAQTPKPSYLCSHTLPLPRNKGQYSAFCFSPLPRALTLPACSCTEAKKQNKTHHNCLNILLVTDQQWGNHHSRQVPSNVCADCTALRGRRVNFWST